VGFGNNGGMDGVQHDAGTLMAGSLIASSEGRDDQPEELRWRWPSVVDLGVDSLRIRTRGIPEEVRMGKVSGERPGRGDDLTCGCRNRRNMPAGAADSNGGFERPDTLQTYL
jgi:hypothetical protein